MEEIDRKLETLEASISELAQAIKELATEVKETIELTNEMRQCFRRKKEPTGDY